MVKKQIGIIFRSHGKAGEFVLDNAPTGLNSLKQGITIEIGFSENFTTKYILETFVKAKNSIRLKLKEINTPEVVAELRDKGVYINLSDVDTGDNEYFINDLVGYSVLNENSLKIGNIIEVWEMPANDVILIQLEDGKLPYPLIDEFILEKNHIEKTIKVKTIEGIDEIIIRD